MLSSNNSSLYASTPPRFLRLFVWALIVALLVFPAVVMAAPAGNGAIIVTKTPSPAKLLPPGGPVTFTVTVENVSGDGLTTVTLISLVDDKFGDLLDDANNALISGSTCVDNTAILYGTTYVCSFVATVSGQAGTVHTDIVTATANDGVGDVTDTDDAVVLIVVEGAIGDYVWYDANHNGVQDVTEVGLGNVTLDLYADTNGNNVLDPYDESTNPSGDVLLATEKTGQDGGYLFEGLDAGVYFVDVTDTEGVLAGLTLTTGPQSSTDPSAPITLGPAQRIYRDADFGYYNEPAPGSAIIGDFVWYDYDGDGVQDPGEPGVPGVTVCATPTGGGAAICATTDDSGHYTIEVPAGEYSVAPTNPPPGTLTTPPVPLVVTVVDGQQFLDADFGYDDPGLGTIGGTIWQDQNSDGTLDGSEPRLAGVSVDLIAAGADNQCGPDDPIVGTVTTDQDGNYLFAGLPIDATNGTKYCVVVSDTQNRLDDFDPSTVYGTADDQNKQQPYQITLTTGAPNDTTADFAYVKAPNNTLGVIGNQVWVESDIDGIWAPGAGEWGVEGVTVELQVRDAAGATLAVVAKTTTGPSGDYVFTAVPPGTYTVVITDEADVLAGRTPTILASGYDGQDNYNQTTLGEVTVILLPDGSVMYADFGYRGGPNAVEVGGLAAEAVSFPIVPLLLGLILGATAAILVRRRII